MGGVHLGKLFGIRIQLDFSLIIIFMLVVFSLGAGVFPAWHPDWSPALVWGTAIASAVLFFASILVHELSHALVAKAYDIPVRSITLFLFGGMANIESEPQSPKIEVLMAGVGPLTSIALGVIFSALAIAAAGLPANEADPAEVIRRMGPVATLLAWLGPINILLGLFNMLPGFPLDGGRVLRAILWALVGDLQTATRWAARTGQAFGWMLALTGIAMAFGVRVPVFGTGLVGGIWLVFIGWFLNMAAVASYRQVVIRKLLEGVQVSRLMRTRLPPAVEESSTVSELVEDYIMRTGESLFPVAADDEIVGIVNASDVRKVSRAEWSVARVRGIATQLSDVLRARVDQDAYEAFQKLTQNDAEEVVVMDEDDEEIRGIIRRQDIVRWIELQSRDRRGGLGGFRPADHPR